MYKNMLIATDGSELASKGVRQGLALAEKLGAKVTFLSVVAPLAPDAIRAAIAGGIVGAVADAAGAAVGVRLARLVLVRSADAQAATPPSGVTDARHVRLATCLHSPGAAPAAPLS